MMLQLIGAAFTLCGFAGLVTRRLCQHQVCGLYAISFIAYAINNAIEQDRLWVCLDAAAFAFFAWLWWTGGGGDDTKRRLRKWARRFRAVRRTAPAGA